MPLRIELVGCVVGACVRACMVGVVGWWVRACVCGCAWVCVWVCVLTVLSRHVTYVCACVYLCVCLRVPMCVRACVCSGFEEAGTAACHIRRGDKVRGRDKQADPLPPERYVQRLHAMLG